MSQQIASPVLLASRSSNSIELQLHGYAARRQTQNKYNEAVYADHKRILYLAQKQFMSMKSIIEMFKEYFCIADACQLSPGRVPAVINVAASDQNDARWPNSNYGQCVTLYAPGVAIRSDMYYSDTATIVASGTSMACPLVSGVAALYLQANPSAQPEEASPYPWSFLLPSHHGARQSRRPQSHTDKHLRCHALLSPLHPYARWTALTGKR